MKIKLGDNFIDPDTIANILEVKLGLATGGAFEARSESDIILKDGHSFRVALSPDIINEMCIEYETTKSNTVDPSEDGGMSETIQLGEAVLKSVKAFTEHTHTISEMLTRLTLHVTDGSNPILVKKVD